ncbi:uncharacterized protein LOC119273667 [Triticum dicoccoides]|uniref:uncharacterized protein LOC119273667 n=1 Tax=Triticum dicoccoides TaxID=85692 RepID=UPI0018902245|nr:uncharacterized protein LOC119273667 [Triticum dicoccoides]
MLYGPLLHRQKACVHGCSLFPHGRAADSPPVRFRRTDWRSTGAVELTSPDGKSVVFPVESQDSMSAPALELDKDEEAAMVGDGKRYEVCSQATSGWTRRVRLGKAPGERDRNPDRKTTVELSVHAYAEKCEGHVINPTTGTEFDLLDEAYEFYNLYSWETGFGIRLAKSRLNVQRTRCMQEIVCACAIRLCKKKACFFLVFCTVRLCKFRSTARVLQCVAVYQTEILVFCTSC